MLTPISKFIRAKIATLPYIQKVYGLATIIEVGVDKQTVPALNEGGAYVPVNLDAHNSMTYLRLTGAIGRETEEHEYIGCKYTITETYPLRIVLYIQGTEDIDCVSYSQNVAFEISRLLTGEQPVLQGAIGAEDVEFSITDTTLIKRDVWNDEFSTDYKLLDKDILVAIDLDVVISGNGSCFVNNPCDLPDFEFDFSNTCCFINRTQVKNIAEGNTSVYHGVGGNPDLLQYWQSGNLLTPFITNATNQQLVINSTDAFDSVSINAIRFDGLCGTQGRKLISIMGGVTNTFNHGLTGKPDIIQYWQGGYLITQPFQTTVTDTQIIIESTDDYLDITVSMLKFSDCGNTQSLAVRFNEAMNHSLGATPVYVQYWQQSGENMILLGGAFNTQVTDSEITVNSPDEYSNVYVKIIAG